MEYFFYLKDIRLFLWHFIKLRYFRVFTFWTEQRFFVLSSYRKIVYTLIQHVLYKTLY